MNKRTKTFRIALFAVVAVAGWLFASRDLEEIRRTYESSSFSIKIEHVEAIGRGRYCFSNNKGDTLCPNLSGLGILKPGDSIWKKEGDKNIYILFKDSTNTNCLSCLISKR